MSSGSAGGVCMVVDTSRGRATWRCATSVASGVRTLARKTADMLRLAQATSFPAMSSRNSGPSSDVSFEVGRGEVVGVYHPGCNGAGILTLLKILSRITEPHWKRRIQIHRSGGEAAARGVGTGVPPRAHWAARTSVSEWRDLLGMSRAEIRAEVRRDRCLRRRSERFLDTPVKRYFIRNATVRLCFRGRRARTSPRSSWSTRCSPWGTRGIPEEVPGQDALTWRAWAARLLFVSHNAWPRCGGSV